MVCANSKASDQPVHTRSLIRAVASCLSLEYSKSVNLLIEYHLEFLSLKGGFTGSSESIYTCQNATLFEITCHGSFVLEKPGII